MISKYTGRPYDFANYNCWHHVKSVRGDNGIATPMFDCVSPMEIQEAFSDGHENPKGLNPVTSPNDFDVVLMGFIRGGRTIWHSGVFYDGMVSHCSRAAKSVIIESLQSIKSQADKVEFWR
ncbi:hypothetical protein [Shewanella sp.]|uniref:hypothetical protein n=1 Tax=Shewanella sp. TaxID=50422 RepID=UPI003F3087A0